MTVQWDVTSKTSAAPMQKNSALDQFRVERDEVERVTWYHHKLRPLLDDSRPIAMFASIGHAVGGKPELLLGVSVWGRPALFLNRVVIRAGEMRYERALPRVKRERFGLDWDEQAVWMATAEDYQMLLMVIASDNVVMRLHGLDGYRDYEMDQRDRRMYEDALHAITELTNELQSPPTSNP